jgi:signal peptidase II
LRVLYISLVIVVVDQLTKILVKGFSIPFLNFTHNGMYHGEKKQVIGDFFRITFIENPGMAFGFDPGIDFKIWLSLFSLVASIGLIIYIYVMRHQSFSLKLALSFILGGAIGNLIDRMFYGVFYGYAPLFYGRVVDFLDFNFFNFTIFGREFDRWPIFNIADSAVTVGVLILIIFYKQHKTADEIRESEKEKIESDVYDANREAEQTNNEITKEEKEENNGESDNGKEIPL